ncbi:cytochrome c oxidase subunit II [Marinicauda pacifica]|uniref:cytochrome c oxidase subunit II n=1 Tax=Marinicauda pacifica TaxID=1133559 RepID=UPI0035C85480
MGAALAVSACSGPFSALDPAGPAARDLAAVWWVMIAGSAVILSGVLGLIGYAFLNRDGLRDVPDRVWLIGGGVGFPMVVLTALLAWALPTGESMTGARGEVYEVQAEAYQWGWRFSYPDGAPGETGSKAGVLYIPAGEPVDVAVTAVDVIHAFWIPRLAGKIDAIPGQTTHLRIQADEPGEYRGQCAEFCGLGHAGMNFMVVAYAPGDTGAAGEGDER